MYLAEMREYYFHTKDSRTPKNIWKNSGVPRFENINWSGFEIRVWEVTNFGSIPRKWYCL